MADLKSIRTELDNLAHAVIELQTLTAVCSDLAGIDSTAQQWPALVSWHSDRVALASEALEALLRRQVIPILEDMPKLTRLSNHG